MAVKLRRRVLSNGRTSLFLDIYNKGQRKFEWLDVQLTGNRDADKTVLQIAEKVRAERELEIASFRYDFSPGKQSTDFFEYAQKVIGTKGQGNQHIFHLFLLHFQKYSGGVVQFSHLTPPFCSDFYSYLQAQEKLNQSTAALYFVKLKTLINQAIRDGIILKNPTTNVKLKHSEHHPKFLTLSEIQQLAITPCSNQTIRNAFLFGCSTGLRISDIYQLKWSHLNQNRIELVQGKTRKLVIIPLNKTAYSVLNAQSTDTDHIFNFPHHRTINRTLKRWAEAAGISRQITFHWSRHTFATLALNAGVDIYTVSKLLGHSKLATTQVYAQVMDATREHAVNLLPELLS